MHTKTIKRLVASFAAVGVAAAVAGLGTFATFTSSTTASHTISSGTVSIALGATGASTNRLTVGASNVVPGDTIQRSADLVNNGGASADNLSGIVLTTTASPSSLLDTEPTNGLQMTIEKCSVPWTEAGTAPAYTYTCSATTSTVLASRAVLGSNMALTNLSSLTTGSTDHLRVTLTLPGAAPNTMQGLTSTISYNFVGTQRVAGNK
ncbi:MAG TPA: TasA family protein [Solirubrobacteraceae bacterium]|jgi:spore coat-associated protein N|nr:TasA family protein [Solirubrobacteraceae bacterium]